MKSALTLLALVTATALAAENNPPATRVLRHPTYHGGRVAFSHLGDLWLAKDDGSDVHRLTDHQARDVYPRFSPDGKWIAFSSNRDGNYDVFVVPVTGGKPRQLTFHTADDTVTGWSTDGKRIVFVSSRSQGVFPSVSTLFEVPFEGGMEQSIKTDWGSWASYSPDGTKLAFTRHPGGWTRQHYRGAYATDLWLMEVATRKFRRLGDADYKGNYLWPMFGRNGEIYFVADRLPGDAEKNVKFGGPEVMKSVYNIWKLSERDGKLTQVTKHTSGNLAFPSISADGKTIVYEEAFGLWKLDVSSGRSKEIPIRIASDAKDNETEWRAVNSEADAFSLSPSGKRAAVVTRGEVFSIATDRGEVQRVTESSWREGNPRWSPDGRRIAFISDRSGREEIWLADERGGNLKQLTDADCDKSSIVWSSDSKSMLWTGSDNKLRRTGVEDRQSEVLAASDIGQIGTPQFSPDGRWVSYSRPDRLLRSHVYVKPLSGGEERRVEGEDFLMSSGAKWTPDGRKLLILGGVGAPGMASLNRSSMQLYSVALTRIDKNPDDRDVDTEEQAQGPQGQNSRSSTNSGRTIPRTSTPDDNPDSVRRTNTTGSASASTRVQVKIEWDGLERRIKRLSSVGGSVTTVVPAPDSKTYAFIASGADEGDSGSGGPALYTIGEDGSRLTRISQGTIDTSGSSSGRGFGGGLSDPQWTRDSRTLYYLQGGGLYAASVSGGSTAGDSSTAAGTIGIGGRSPRSTVALPSTVPSSSGPRRVSFTVRMEVDEAAERHQVFEEAWRVMKNRFYDPNMHGVDWAAVKAKYESLLAYIADSDELHTVIMQMIGELNASHTGVSGGGRNESGERISTRYPGFDLEPDASGRYRVAYIHQKGPADHDYVKLAVGNYILAVNGKPLRTNDNYWRVFNLIPGKKFEFTVNSQPETEGAWTLSLEPISGATQANLDYDRWVADRKTMVEKLSKDEVGYLHIRAMDAASFRRFQRDLLDHLDKKALIIDQRFNGGGGIDQELLEILNQRTRYQTWRGRNSVSIPRPVQAFFGPMVVLQNERSASDAEMFPDGFRKLGLGKLVGVPTMGAVIGTGSYRLMDGSSIRTPGFGVYTASGENLENYGVQPDVFVDNGPEDFLAGHDRQIEKALEVLKVEMK